MRTTLKVFASTLSILSLAWSCGKASLNYDGASPPPDHDQSSTTEYLPTGMKSIKVQTGTLVLVEQALIRSGTLNYAIYEDGLIAYDGEVHFFGYSNAHSDDYGYIYDLMSMGPGIVETFKGIIRVSPKLIKPETYAVKDVTVSEKEVQFKVVERQSSSATLQGTFLEASKKPYRDHGSPTDHDAVADINIDLSSPYIIDIHDVTVTMRVLGVPMVLRATKKKD